MSVLALKNLDVPEVVAAYVDRAGLPRERVTFEVTENRVQGGSAFLDILARLRLLRFNLSIDDFGTGESGIQRLKRLPFTELKIDRSFVDGASTDEDLRSILSTSIELGRRLRMKVVAEGVESADDWRLLEELGCDQIQGYLASRPLPAASILRFAKQWNLRARREEPASRVTRAH
jgi:EAL domain-containing protein (putative c-di-GMP-specific phosphodiesterase class I)